jgi:hypothetical protein
MRRAGTIEYQGTVRIDKHQQKIFETAKYWKDNKNCISRPVWLVPVEVRPDVCAAPSAGRAGEARFDIR